MKIFPKYRRVFLRTGDGASSYDLNPIDFHLSDGTDIRINISYNSWKDKKLWDDGETFKWKIGRIKREWYVSVSCYDDQRRWNTFIVSEYKLTEFKDQVHKIINRVAACKNRMLGLPMKKRVHILKFFLRHY